jgi:hypothetical protein
MPETDDRPYVAGAAAGVVAWAFGYVVTYLLAASEIRESSLNRIVELLEGDPATHELVGWVFFNAHFVDIVFEGLPAVGSQATSFVGGENGLTPLLYLLPVVALLATGLALARATGATTAAAGAVAGLTATSGYLLASVIGVVLFEVSAAGATGAPETVPAIAVAGLAYPAVLASAGGAVAGATADRDSPERRDPGT